MADEIDADFRASWGVGPWQSEPDRKEWRDPATGLPCLAVRNLHLGFWCGYVGAPPGHPLHGKPYDELDIDVHGGPTYAKGCQGDICHVPAPGESDNVWWIGFDCGHAFDQIPFMAGRDFMKGWEELVTYRDLAYVEKECARLASQLVT